MFIYRFLLMAVLLLAVSSLNAAEGMWPLYDLDKLPFDEMKAHGLELSAEEIYNQSGTGLSRAVIQVGGGSGSFVSKNGLIVTNHHVAVGAAQKQSTVDQNYLLDGFYAGSMEDEIPAIGYNAYVTLEAKDVTLQVLDGISDSMNDFERYQALDMAKKRIIGEAEEGRDVFCEVASMFGGTKYVLYTYFKIRDIRIVYIPPFYIGNYGGDIDNWMWPRHVGDFSFLRAYTAPDGSPAEYSADNIPYHPEVFLPISSAGIKEGDISMVMGFPGRTNRYASSYEIEHLENFYYPMAIRNSENRIAMLEEASAQDSAVAIRLASRIQGINNYLKNNYGMVEGFKKFGLLAVKQENERMLTEFINADPAISEKYGHILPQLKKLYEEISQTSQRDFNLDGMAWYCELYEVALALHKWSAERDKPDAERERGCQDRDSIKTREWLEDIQINFVAEVDKNNMKYYFGKLLKLPPEQKIAGIESIFEDKNDTDKETFLDEYIDDLYSKTILGDKEKRLGIFEMSREEIEKLDDPFIRLAVSLREELDAIEDRSKRISGAENRLTPKLIAAYAAWKKGNLYPDANGTIRFSCGVVKGYSPRDAVRYDYLTGLSGVIQKETGEDPFIVPDAVKQAFLNNDTAGYTDEHIGDVPVNFLSTNDGTGGNSGSPVINGRGEIIGLLFDGNYESIAADYLFDERIVRSINVDIRYVLYLIDRVYHLESLLSELTVH